MRPSLGAALEKAADRFGDRPFVTFVDTDETLSYASFNDRANQAARGLRGQGVQHGSFVALMLRNSLDFLIFSYALKKLGAVEVAVNPDFRGAGLSRMINMTESHLLITSSEFLAPLAEVAGDLGRLHTLLMVDRPTGVPDALCGLRRLDVSDVLSADPRNLGVTIRDDDLAYVLFSSGTTGRSKGVMLSHRYAMVNAEALVETYGLTERDAVYTPWPLHHFGASVVEVLPTLLTGGQVALRSRLTISKYWDEVRRYGATWAMMMGGSQKWLWDRPVSPDDRNHTLRFMWGGPFPVNRLDFEERFGLRTYYCYGMSDCGMLSLQSATATEPPNSCGKIRSTYYDVRIVDDFDVELPIGATGEIVCRPKAPGIILKGYFGMPEYTLDSFRNLWFHTGDLGRFDHEGHLFFLERKKNVIKFSGENILPAEVEEVLHQHPAIEESAVIGVANADGGEDVVAFAELRAGRALAEEELKSFCHQRMARWMVPMRIIFLEKMPRTTTDKPALGELRKLAKGGRTGPA